MFMEFSMKNLFKFLGIITLVAVIGFSFTTCGDGNNDNNQTQDSNDNNQTQDSWKKAIITFDKNGGDTEANPKTKTVTSPATTIDSLPTAPTRNGYNFVEWNTQINGEGTSFNKNTIVSEDIIVYAQWELPVNVPGSTLLNKFQWLNSNATSNYSYIIEVTTDEQLAPQTLSYAGRNNINIKLVGIESEKTISIYGDGSLFTIRNGNTLIIDDNIKLKGKSGYYENNAPLVQVTGGNLIMNGGEISGNNHKNNSFSSYGGGIYINGTFTMNGGKISDNTSSGSPYSYGGGVYINGTFTMNGGEISGNSSYSGKYGSSSDSCSFGGGVCINGTFEKKGGIITGYSSDTTNGNKSSGTAHAVFVQSSEPQSIRSKNNSSDSSDILTYIHNGPNPPTISGSWDD
jgi:uncharacterized repeat protein (TIGR02543 family)